jgi:hypothetical protein
MSVIINGDTGITTPAETVQGALTTTGNTILGDATTDTLNVGAGGLVKDASGNVGIGTASPVGKLDLISGAARMYFSNQSATAFFTAVNTANSAYAPMAINGSELILKTGDAERMRIDSSGNVGIGATPNLGTYNKELTLSSGAGQFCGLSIQNTTTGTSGGFTAYISNTLAYLFNRSNDALLLGTNNTERMRIDSSGNVLVGTAAQLGSAILSVKGTTTNGTTAILNCSNSAGTNQFSVSTAGDIYAGTIPTQTGTTLIMNASGFICKQSSSLRYKKDVEPIDIGLDFVMSLNPVKYNLKHDDVPQVGFIAEDFPDSRLVSESMIDLEDASKGLQVESVNYAQIVAPLVKAIQEQQALITQLQADVATLKALKA